MTYEILNPAHLRPHPDFARLFDPLSREEFIQLKEEMAGGARFQPLLVSPEGLILAGVEHWQAALELGWDQISVCRAPRLSTPAQTRSLMVAENIRSREVREEHLWRGMNNFFDMEPLRPPGGW